MNVEQKHLQYSDDITLFIYLKRIWSDSVLDEFHDISGPQMNVETTKVVKIGARRDSRFIFCRDLDLLWTNKFSSLGIKFDADNMADIMNMNISSKFTANKYH